MKYFKDVLKNIKNWDAGEKFQQATVAYIVHFIYPSNEIEELKRVFKTIDKNGDGRLTYDELSKCFELVFGREVSNIEIGKIIGEIDGDADGYISYEEFLRVSINKSALLDETNLKLAFDSFDLNKDGKLSAEEIKKVLGTNQNDYVNYLINAIDQDNNQEIDFDEFKQLMKSLIQTKMETFISVEKGDKDMKELREREENKENLKHKENEKAKEPEKNKILIVEEDPQIDNTERVEVKEKDDKEKEKEKDKEKDNVFHESSSFDSNH